MAQSKRMSLVEAVASNAIAFVISVFANFAILPLLGLYPNMWQSVGMVCAFTVISVIRGYYVRRFFEWYGGLRIEFASLAKGS